jgi:hypothetical protein
MILSGVFEEWRTMDLLGLCFAWFDGLGGESKNVTSFKGEENLLISL